jgi:hypothetical protein
LSRTAMAASLTPAATDIVAAATTTTTTTTTLSLSLALHINTLRRRASSTRLTPRSFLLINETKIVESSSKRRASNPSLSHSLSLSQQRSYLNPLPNSARAVSSHTQRLSLAEQKLGFEDQNLPLV